MGSDVDKDKDEDADFDGTKVKGKVVKPKYNLPSMQVKKKPKKGKFVESKRNKVGDDTPQELIDAKKNEYQSLFELTDYFNPF